MNPMLLRHFGLCEQPFAVTPDPRFLYNSETHREALASLLHGISSDRGFLALIGKPGMGKTTLLFHLLEQYRNRALTAFLFQTQCEWREFLGYLFADLGMECADARDFVTMHQRLNRMLAEQARRGRFCLVIIDEAQNLDSQALETIRLLSDFETSRTKLLQIVLAGQPSFEHRLADPSLLQLRQRLSMICRLSPLNEREVNEYIDHRLRVAGHSGSELFTFEAREIVARVSEGIPRVISNLCFNSMSLAFASGQKLITPELVNEVATDLALVSHAAEVATNSTYASRNDTRVRENGISSPADRTPLEPIGDTASAKHAAVVRSAGPHLSGRLDSVQVAATVHKRHVPATPAPGTPARARSAGGVNRPALRVVERALFAMAGAAAVIALVLWIVIHHPLNTKLVLPPRSAPVSTNFGDPESGRVPYNSRTRDVERVTNSPAASVRSTYRSVHEKDSVLHRVSQYADTNQGAAPQPPASTAGSRIQDRQPRKVSIANTPSQTRPAILEHNALTLHSRTAVPSPPVTITRMVKPEYPEAAKSASIQGIVTLQALVDTDGLIRDIRILNGDPALTNAAVEAVRHWQYRPYREGGIPVMFQTIIRIRFMLDENSPES
jgi:general secretion pathway protein A